MKWEKVKASDSRNLARERRELDREHGQERVGSMVKESGVEGKQTKRTSPEERGADMIR